MTAAAAITLPTTRIALLTPASLPITREGLAALPADLILLSPGGYPASAAFLAIVLGEDVRLATAADKDNREGLRARLELPEQRAPAAGAEIIVRSGVLAHADDDGAWKLLHLAPNLAVHVSHKWVQAAVDRLVMDRHGAGIITAGQVTPNDFYDLPALPDSVEPADAQEAA